MDFKKMVEELVDKIKDNPKMLAKFQDEPVKVIEELTGLDLPDDQIEQLVDLVKAKIDLDKVGSFLGGFFKK